MSGDGQTPELELYGAEVWRIVHAIPQLEQMLGRRVVVVGGLAVLCRIGAAYRVTTDIDVVNRRNNDSPSHLDVLVDAGGQRVDPAGVIISTPAGDVRVDVLEISTRDIEDPPDDRSARLHVLAHEWGRITASRLRIRAQQLDDPTPVAATALIAEPGPIIAMKLQSLPDRPRAKESTDLLDIARLTLGDQTGSAVHTQLTGAPAGLRADAAWHVEQWFVKNATRTVKLINSTPEGQALDRVAVDLVGELLLRSLEGS